MRYTGVSAYGIRTPVISPGDGLPAIVADSLAAALAAEGITLKPDDVVGVTESVVAKAQGNYADTAHIAADIANKFGGGGTVGVVFPILSRNRFQNILKGIARGAGKVYILLNYPQDEVGNPIMDPELADELDELKGRSGPIPAAEFKRLAGAYAHPFTGVDYISLYESLSENIEVYLSRDPRDILRLTPNVLAAEIHSRERTKARLLKAGAKTVYTLADILNAPVNGSGYNPDYGVLGSNLSTGERLKLFPRDCESFVAETRKAIAARTGVSPEFLIYGDGAFKDPAAGIWELADPVVSPAYTERLAGHPNEIKLKLVADELFGDTPAHEKTAAVTRLISAKQPAAQYSEGTTPRKYADLLGSLCDLISGSGDKGTPVILIRGYFDDYASE